MKNTTIRRKFLWASTLTVLMCWGTANANTNAINSYQVTNAVSDLSDGDLVHMYIIGRGHVECDENNNVIADSDQEIFPRTDEYLWKVHALDANNDGQMEYQFENMRNGDASGIYLKMNSQDEVFCGKISGSGEPASWQDDGVSNDIIHGNSAQISIGRLKNVRHGKCLWMENATSPVASSCSSSHGGRFILFSILKDVDTNI